MIVRTITIHCSASPQGRGDDAETIHRWHRERGFDGIGYHWVILENGTCQAGRPHYWKGAHVKGHNRNNIGICLIGEGGDATDIQLTVLANLVRTILERHPGADIVGHYELDPAKDCPGFDVPRWVESLYLDGD